jgi:nicotinate-nucleotide adenylyltransferase
MSVAKDKLGQKRYIHSVNVKNQALKLAEIYGCDKNKTEVAGLLHDISKDDNLEIQLQTIKNGGIILNNVEKNNPNLFHAIAGSAFVQTELGITDIDIINAIRYHTTARANMSLLEKIIYLADLTSDDRDYSDVNHLRKIVKNDLDLGMHYSLVYIIPDLVKRNLMLHHDTVSAYNEFCLDFVEDYNNG